MRSPGLPPAVAHYLAGPVRGAIFAWKFRHGANSLLRWNSSNVRPVTDAAGNIKFSKTKAAEKIDGALAAAMAVGVALTYDEQEGRSVYGERGLLIN